MLGFLVPAASASVWVTAGLLVLVLRIVHRGCEAV